MIVFNVLVILIFIAIGRLYHYKCHHLGEITINKLSSLITYILLPAIIVNAMASLDISAEQVKLPLSNILWVLIMAAIAIISCYFLKYRKARAGSLVTAFCSLEGGSIGLVLMLILYANHQYLAEFFLFDITHAVMLFTVTYFIAYCYGSTKQINIKLITGFLIGPIPISLIFGIILSIFHIAIPHMISTVFNFLGYLILPIVVFILGYRVEYSHRDLLPAIIFSVVKILVGISIAVIVIKLLKITGEGQCAVIFLTSALPPSFLVMVFAEELKLDSKILASYLPISSLISFIILLFSFKPIFHWWLGLYS